MRGVNKRQSCLIEFKNFIFVAKALQTNIKYRLFSSIVDSPRDMATRVNSASEIENS